MTIRYKCEECGAVLNIKDELAGTVGHCPRCKVEFKVPAPDEGAVVGKDAVGKEIATVAGPPAAEGQKRPVGAFNEDDIESILEASGPVKSASDYRVGADGFDEESGESDDERPASRRQSRHSNDPADADEDDSGEAEADEDDSDRRRKKKKMGKGAVKEGAAKGDSAESASIARNLMGRGDQTVVREEKKGGRPFGGADGGRDEDKGEFSAKEVAGYFAKRTWPLIIGLTAFIGLCYWLYTSLSPGVNLPFLVPVSGTVTLDGKPLAKALVRFQPIPEPGAKPNLYLATPVGSTDENGKYELLYLVVNDKRIFGAPLGKHMVVINATDKVGGELLPLRYSYPPKSKLTATVVKGMPPQNFDLTSEEEPSSQ